MPRRGRVSKETARAHEQQAWELRREGRTHSQIAELMGLERTTVTKILQRVRKRVQSKLDSDVEQHRSEQIARYEKIYAEAMAAWELSKDSTKKTAVRKKVTGGKFEGEEESVKVEEERGDPRYLATAMNALASLQKLVGMDVQPKQEIVDSARVNSMSPEERSAKLQDIIAVARDRAGKRVPAPPVFIDKKENEQIVQ